jgi:hypothetical protein
VTREGSSRSAGILSPWLAFALVASSNAACHLFATHSPPDCRLSDRVAYPPVLPGGGPAPPFAPADLSGLQLYRNTFVVSSVGAYGYHFEISHWEVEQSYDQLFVVRDAATGHLRMWVERGPSSADSPSLADAEQPPSAELIALQRDLDEELRARCPQSRGWSGRYLGTYRLVVLEELMPLTTEVDDIGGGERFGWLGRVTLAVDEGLTRIIAAAPASWISRDWSRVNFRVRKRDRATGHVWLKDPTPLEWVDFVLPKDVEGTILLVDRLAHAKSAPLAGTLEERLLSRALEAARRWGPHESTKKLSEIIAAQGVSLLPSKLAQAVHVKLSVRTDPAYLKHTPPPGEQDAVIALPLREAVGGTARGTSSFTVAGIPITVRASLALGEPTPVDAKNGEKHIAGTLAVRIEDDSGNGIDRSYPLDGKVWVDGTTVALETRLDVAYPLGASKLNPLELQLPGRGEAAVLDFSVTPSIYEDPRAE